MNSIDGWFCLVGGTLSALGMATAKKFHLSDFANSDGVITEKERETEVKITPFTRWMIVVVCIAIAIYGGIRIQENHAWNPFYNGDPTVPTR